MLTLEITLLIVSVVLLALVLLFLILLFVKGNKNQDKSSDKTVMELVRLEEKINQNQQELELKIHNFIQEQALNNNTKLEQSLQNQMNLDTQRLNNFQTTILQNLSTYMTGLNTKLDQNLMDIHTKVDASLKDGFVVTSESMNNLSKQLGVMEQAQKNIESLQGEITTLNNVLGNNQQRGKYGEWQLELLLQNMFGDTKGVLYDTQYALGNEGEGNLKPDAVIFLDGKDKKKIVPIDSKFSLVGYEDLFDSSKTLSEEEIKNLKSQFRMAIRRRIDETKKYLLPGTTIQTAIMFIPNDGVFAFVETEMSELSEYARSKNVVLTCPSILGPLLYSFRIVQIEDSKNKNLASINVALNDLAKEFKRFMPRWQKLNDSIQRLTTSSSDFDTTVNKIDKKFTGISSMELADDVKEIEENK